MDRIEIVVVQYKLNYEKLISDYDIIKRNVVIKLQKYVYRLILQNQNFVGLTGSDSAVN